MRPKTFSRSTTTLEKSHVPVSLVGQDTRFSPWRPGFESRTGSFFFLLSFRAPPDSIFFFSPAHQQDQKSTEFLWMHCRPTCLPFVSMPEWLRGQTRNLMGFARVGSNPAANGTRLDGRAVQGASFRHWSLRRRGFESHSNHFDFFWSNLGSFGEHQVRTKQQH